MDSLTPPAGFIDPALVPAPEITALREELAHALDASSDAKVALTVRVERGAGASADIPVPEVWGAELLYAFAALVAGRAVQWAAGPTARAVGPADGADSPPLTPGRASDDPETGDEIGTGELARLLGVSAPTAVAVLDRGEIPSHRTTARGHRRVSRTAALAWRRRRDAQTASLRDLVRVAEADERAGPSLPTGTPEDPDHESEA